MADSIQGEPQEQVQVGTPDQSTEVTPEATEVVAAPSETSENTGGNWWDVSGIKDEAAVQRIKSIQPEFQKHVERVKELERERISHQQQLQSIAAEVQAYIADPEKYRNYRRQLGYQDEVPVKQEVQEFKLDGVETVKDLETKLSQHIQQVNQSWEAKLRTELARQQYQFEQRVGMVAEPVAKERWETALGTMKSKYGVEFANREQEVVNKIVNGPYKSLYGAKDELGKPIDEKSLLERVFRAEFPDEVLRASRVKTAAKAEVKKAAVTAPPKGKGGKTTPSGSAKDDVIARIRQKGLSFES